MTLKQHTKDVPGNSITFRRVFNAVLDKEMLSYIKAFKCCFRCFYQVYLHDEGNFCLTIM